MSGCWKREMITWVLPRNRPQNVLPQNFQRPLETPGLSGPGPGPALGLHGAWEPAFYKPPAVTVIKGGTEI